MLVTLSNALTSYLCDCSPFVTDEHDDHVAVAVLSGVLQPCGLCGRESQPTLRAQFLISHQVIERVSPSDIIDKQGSCCSPVKKVLEKKDISKRILPVV